MVEDSDEAGSGAVSDGDGREADGDGIPVTTPFTPSTNAPPTNTALVASRKVVEPSAKQVGGSPGCRGWVPPSRI